MILTKPNYSNKAKESRYVEVKLEGVPTIGLIDNGSDITIVWGDLFYHIVEKVRLDPEPSDHKACNYDQTEAHHVGWTDGHDT